MKPLKANQLREMSVIELQDELGKQKSHLFDFHRQGQLRQLNDYKSISVTRHNIARILTLISVKQKEGSA
jgi:ribosomal protein L29